jgi:TolB-like protein
MTKSLALAFVSLLLGAPVVATAQCPDGSPPPCRSTAARAARPAPVALNPRGWIVVPFTNVTRTPALEWLRDGAVNLLSTDLAKWNDLVVVPDKRVADLVRTVPVARASESLGLADGLAVARAAGAGQLVMGDFFKLGAGARIVANVFDARTGQRLRSVTQIVPVVDSIFTLMGAVARGVLAVAPPPNAKTGDIGTSRVDAYQAYLRGITAHNRLRIEAADSAFREALRLDSTFALAHRGLAINGIGYPALARTPTEWRDHALAAQSLARGLSARDRALVDAAAARVRGDPVARCKAILPLVQADSTDVESLFEFAECNADDNRTASPGRIDGRFETSIHQSLRAYERALSLDPAFFPAFDGIMELLLSTGRRYYCTGCAANAVGSLLWIGDTLDARPYEDSTRRALRSQQLRELRSVKYARRIAESWMAAGGGRRAAYGLAETLLLSGQADSAVRLIKSAGVEFTATGLSEVLLALDIAFRSRHPTELQEWLASARRAYRQRSRSELPPTEWFGRAFGRTAVSDSVVRAISDDLAARSGMDATVLFTYRRLQQPAALGLPLPALAAAESLVVVSAPERCSVSCLMSSLQPVNLLTTYIRRPAWPPFDRLRVEPSVSALSRGDTSELRRLAAENERELHDGGTIDVNVVRHAYSAWLIAGDSLAALRVARFHGDSLFPRNRSVARPNFVDPSLDVRMIRLRAELAAAFGYKAEAREWLDFLLALWKDVDPWLQPEVDRLKALRAKVAG